MGERRGMKALELWCRRVTEGYPGVKVENMTTSWRDGLAFCAVIHHFRPDLIDFDRLDKNEIYKNNELAFRIAERQLGIPALLDAEDMVEYEVPDRLSILTYLSQFYQAFASNQQGATSPTSRSHNSSVSEILSPSTNSPSTKVGPGRLETCWSCRRPVFLAERLVAFGKLRHRTCFTCVRCGHQLSVVGCYETEDGDFVCETCPDEEKSKDLPDSKEQSSGSARVETDDRKYDELSLNYEEALESVLERREDVVKQTLLEDTLPDETSDGTFLSDDNKMESPSGVSIPENNAVSSENPSVGMFVNSSVEDNQPCTASDENSKDEFKDIYDSNFSNDSAINLSESESSDDFRAEVAKVIDGIIEEAIEKIKERVSDADNSENESSLIIHKDDNLASDNKLESSDINAQVDTLPVDSVNDNKTVETSTEFEKEVENNEQEKVESCKLGVREQERKEEKKSHDSSKSYPEELNPFADDDEVDQNKPKVVVHKPPVPAARVKHRAPLLNKEGKKIIVPPVANLNPFWSDGEEPSSDEDNRPVPAPRKALKTPEPSPKPIMRSKFGSSTSLSSLGSSISTCRKKKGPAPLPPMQDFLRSPPSPPSSTSSPSGYGSRSPVSSHKGHRKSRPAPLPPASKPPDSYNTFITEKKDKDYENKMKQNLCVPDKSTYGKWKRKKNQAPALPIPQRRRITPLPLPDLYRELEDLEVQQRELERQGVTIEQTIRQYETDGTELESNDGDGGRDIEGLILQLFEIVNQKNELFRRQAELMYLRRQQRLEEEHADLEYQIRCLMGRPERNKTDTDKAQEEDLIRRLVEVVERRNEIVQCLDMDRKREVEEDISIHHHLEVFAAKGNEEESPEPTAKHSTKSLLKIIKKKKFKKDKDKDKGKETNSKTKRDADKDIDETVTEEEIKTLKSKKKWFLKP